MRPALVLLSIVASLGGAAPACAATLLPEEQIAIGVHDANIASVVQVDVDYQWDDKPAASMPPELEKLVGKLPKASSSHPYQEHIAGTGVVWDAAGHVVVMSAVAGKPGAHIELTWSDGSRRTAKVVGSDPALDITVVQIDGTPTGLRPIVVGPSTGLRVGQRVYAFASAWGRGVVMTQGMLSGISTAFADTGRPSLLVNAPINPGNAGGPVLDTNGQMIGLIQGLLSNNGNAGITMALPSDLLAWAVPRLIADGHIVRPQLGINVADPKRDKEQAALPEGLPAGVAVQAVEPEGPAGRAGLRARAGDAVDVITGIDGTPIRGFPDLRAALDRLRPGQACTLAVWRAGKTINLPVTLAAEKAR